MAGIATGLALLFAAASPADGPTLTLSAGDATVGSAIHATAHLAESPGAEGQIAFEVFGPGDASCSGPALTPAPASATVNGEGDYATEFTPSGAGTYHWSAHYSGDLVNPPADAACAAASIVAKASPGISGTATNAAVGSTIQDEVTVSGGFSPGGEVTFKVFGPGDATCATALATKTAVIASGHATSPTFTTPQAGQFRWTASYPGDANNQAAETACGAANQTSTVAKASPTMSGTASNATVGSAIHDEVTLSGGFSPTGEVTFKVFGPADTTCTTPLATKTAAISSGHATSPNFTTPQAGQFRWTASYPGDTNNQAAETACGAANQASTVAKASPTLAGTATPSVLVGATIKDEATFSGGFSPGGEVTFKVFGPGDTTCTTPLATKTAAIASGQATSPTFTTTQAGQYRWTASYPGDGNNQAAETACGAANQTSTASKASPTLSGTASNAGVGGNIHDEVTVNAGFSPSGEVTFKVFGPGDTGCTTALATKTAAVASGHATSPNFTATQAGQYRWTASYPGDGNNQAAETACGAANQASTVGKASPTLSGTATASVVVGATIKDEATFSGGFSPTGEVTFKVFGPGDTGCTTPLAIKTAAIVSGQATSPTFTTPQAGQFRWTASYPGDGDNEAAETTCGAANQTSTASKASPTLSGTATNAAVGSTIQDEVTVSGGFSPGGEVTFKVFGPGDATCATALATKTAVIASGHATSPTFTTPQAGQFRWTASYPGDANNQAAETACGAANQTSTVAKASPTMSGTASNATVGSAIHDEVTLSGGFSPTGEVTFKVFGPADTTCTTPLATKTAAISSGHATSPNFTTPQAGQFRWTASYPGDTNNQAAETACGAANQASTVAKASPTLAGTATPSVLVGATIKDEATFSGGFSPGGEVTFKVFGPGDTTCTTPLATKTAAIASGQATSPTFTTTQAGQYRWTASYPGDGNNQAAETACGAANQTSTASKASPTLSGTASNAGVGGNIHDEVTVNAGFSPSGEVTFKVFGPGDTGCTTALATKTAAVASGHATSPNFTATQAGQYRWTASYPGDGNNQAAETTCGAANQASTVAKASPGISGVASDATVNNAIHDEATLSGGFSPGGEVTFKVFGPGDTGCTTALATKTAAIASGHAISPSFIPPTVGAYRWTATYPGDTNNEAVETACGAVNQTSTVSKAIPGLSGTATASVVVGATIKDEATFSGGFSPTGEVTFKVFGPGDTGCSTPLATTTAPISSGHATSPNFTTPHAGEYRWTASYQGDANNQTVDTTCGTANQTSTVTKASPAISGTATLNAVVGSAIKDEATLTGGFSPGGEVTFKVFGPGDTSCTTALATKTAPVVSGHATSPNFTPEATGAFRWKASYPGDGDNQAAETGCGSGEQVSTVSKATPTLAGTASNATVGATIHDEVSFSAGFSPSGEVTFKVFAPGDNSCAAPLATETAPIASGHATSPSFTAPHAGQYRWTASYPGDADNQAAETTCGAANQTSTVAKASPNLSGTAESTVTVGSTITDNVTLSGGFGAAGQLVFRLYGPGDTTCGAGFLYKETVPVSGDGSYAPAGFAPPAGLYTWTVEYSGDTDNNAKTLPCGAANQSSAVGVLNVTLSTSAGSGTVGTPLAATATIEKGAIPSGQLTFSAFPPEDASCSGAPAFSSSVPVSGNGSYVSANFTPTRVGAFRWTVAYSGDPHHAATKAACGAATSAVLQAAPSISGGVKAHAKVGAPYRMAAVLAGGYAPGGTVSFRLYGPSGTSCTQPFAIDTVTVTGNGTILSDPFTPQRTGQYSFVAIYSGDAANQSASQACDQPGQTTQVEKSTPKLKATAKVKHHRRISIAAKLSGATSPSGSISFRLYRPGDTSCSRRPAFDGAVTVKDNGPRSLAAYLATKRGIYRLVVSYSGDPRNRPVKGECRTAQKIRAG